MLYIYTPVVTPRIEFVLKFIFNRVLQVNYDLTTESDSCRPSHQPFINYSGAHCGAGIWIPSSGLLQEEGLKAFKPEVGLWEELPTLFPISESDVPFDLFGAVFYLITRYEEYNNQVWDKHGRFDHTVSIAYQNNFLQRPVIDEWILKLKELLQSKYPNLHIGVPKYQFVSTIDVDHPYCYLGKSKWFMFAKMARSLMQLDLAKFTRMMKVLLYLEKDPYQQFQYLDELHHELGCKYTMFVHVGPIGKHDRHTIYPLFFFHNYLRKQHHSHVIGIHPSYHAAFSKSEMMREKIRLERYLHSPVGCSRNHYLRIRMPFTYRTLNEIGVKRDFSMGYAGIPGFRAGTCHPHFFYDVEKDEETLLMIHPTILMDGTLNFYQKRTPEQGLAICRDMVDKCRNVNGQFVLLWHNNSLSDLDEWAGWKSVYEEVLQYARSI